jgi:hypothetical protein
MRGGQPRSVIGRMRGASHEPVKCMNTARHLAMGAWGRLARLHGVPVIRALGNHKRPTIAAPLPRKKANQAFSKNHSCFRY